jgi:hypothetical protein
LDELKISSKNTAGTHMHIHTPVGFSVTWPVGGYGWMNSITHFPIRPKSGQNEIIVVGPWVVTESVCVKENSLLVFAGYVT